MPFPVGAFCRNFMTYGTIYTVKAAFRSTYSAFQPHIRSADTAAVASARLRCRADEHSQSRILHIYNMKKTMRTESAERISGKKLCVWERVAYRRKKLCTRRARNMSREENYTFGEREVCLRKKTVHSESAERSSKKSRRKLYIRSAQGIPRETACGHFSFSSSSPSSSRIRKRTAYLGDFLPERTPICPGVKPAVTNSSS